MSFAITIPTKNAGDGLANTELNALAQPITAPSAPTVAYQSGTTLSVGLALVSGSPATVIRTPEAVVFAIEYTFTPSAGGTTVFTLSLPSTWSLGALTYSVRVTSTGAGVTTAVAGAPVNALSCTTGSSVQHTLTLLVQVIKQ